MKEKKKKKKKRTVLGLKAQWDPRFLPTQQINKNSQIQPFKQKAFNIVLN